jgi:hypothetical protein
MPQVTFDPVAGEGVETLAQAAAQGGIIILYGALAHSATPFPLFAALRKGWRVIGGAKHAPQQCGFHDYKRDALCLP